MRKFGIDLIVIKYSELCSADFDFEKLKIAILNKEKIEKTTEK